MNEKIILFKKNAEKFGLSLSDEQLEKFRQFESIISDFNKHTNLLSSNDINLIWEKHFSDSISVFKIIDKNKKYKIADIGSGGGFPCVPISIIAEKSDVLALDSTNKKVEFLKQAVNLLNLQNFKAINERAEQVAHNTNLREQFDIVTARAVGNLALLSELCLPFVKIGGKFIAYKSMKVNDEIKNAQKTIEVCGGEIKDIFEYELNLNEHFKRNLVVIEKTQETPENYPRSFGVIKNNPLK